MAGCGTEDWADDLGRIGGFHFEDSYKRLIARTEENGLAKAT